LGREREDGTIIPARGGVSQDGFLPQESRWYSGAMPTVLRDGPYRFFFYSGDRDEPPHAHVERDACEAKSWLDPVRLERSRGFSRREIAQVQAIVERSQRDLLDRWNEYFDV
jgi:hypothetical protein